MVSKSLEPWVLKFKDSLDDCNLDYCRLLYSMCKSAQVTLLSNNLDASIRRAEQTASMGGQLIVPAYYNNHRISKSFDKNSVVVLVIADREDIHIVDLSRSSGLRNRAQAKLWKNHGLLLSEGPPYIRHLFMMQLLEQILEGNNFVESAREIQSHPEMYRIFSKAKGLKMLSSKLSTFQCNGVK